MLIEGLPRGAFCHRVDRDDVIRFLDSQAEDARRLGYGPERPIPAGLSVEDRATELRNRKNEKHLAERTLSEPAMLHNNAESALGDAKRALDFFEGSVERLRTNYYVNKENPGAVDNKLRELLTEVKRTAQQVLETNEGLFGPLQDTHFDVAELLRNFLDDKEQMGK